VTPTAEELRAHCGELLASFKIPTEIFFASEIPKTSIGKQQVGVLRARYAAGQLGGPSKAGS